MLYRFNEDIEAVVGQIVSKTDDLCRRIGRSVHDEDDFTSRMADRIEQSIDGVLTGGMIWNVLTRKLPWRGKGSEESCFGADLGLVLRMSGRGFDVSKGYLIQAKMLPILSFENLNTIPFAKDDRIFDQCRKMLDITQEAYVWFYSEAGISVLRAGSLVDTDPSRIREMNHQGLHGFLTRAFKSWNGDYSLGDLSRESLTMMAAEYPAKQTVVIHAHEVRPEE